MAQYFAASVSGVSALGRVSRWLVTAAVGLGALPMIAGCERTDSVQRGYRGLSLTQLYKPSVRASTAALHSIPEPEPTDPPDPEGPAIKDVFKNVQVMNDLTVLEFARLMQAMATWVAPEQGCEFCHNPQKLESDEKYTKVVARRMLQMTRHINTDWKAHVAGTGVTCWTCHRGQAVPSGDWFARLGGSAPAKFMGEKAGQNTAGVNTNGNTALPTDPLSAFLVSDTPIRIQGTQALAGDNRHSIKQAEWSYSLMIYMAKSLGVNCTYCHNTRALARWEESAPQRSTAWYGIRMVRDLNNAYLIPLKPKFPVNRLSAEGDGPKIGCETCHKGAFKPLYGVTMLNDYPELRGVFPDRTTPVAAPPADAASAAGTGKKVAALEGGAMPR